MQKVTRNARGQMRAFLMAGTAADAETWSCSVVDEGKPQVVKVTTNGGTATLNSYRQRLLKTYMNEAGDVGANLIRDDRDSLVVVTDGKLTSDPGLIRDVQVDVVAIEKRSGKIAYTTVSTAYLPAELKGTCTQ
jgi:hypothetical protein